MSVNFFHVNSIMKIKFCINLGGSRAGAPTPHPFEYFVHFDCRTRIYFDRSLHTITSEFLSINSLKVMISSLLKNLYWPVVLKHEFYSLIRAHSKNIGYVYRLYVKRHQDNPQTQRILPLPIYHLRLYYYTERTISDLILSLNFSFQNNGNDI